MLVGLTTIWLGLTLAVEELGAPRQVFNVLLFDPERVVAGEVWRLFTAPLVHALGNDYRGGEAIFTLFLLYFFATPLYDSWGTKRLYVMLGAAAVAGELVQLLGWALLPEAARAWAVPKVMFGGYPMAMAAVTAWAFSNRHMRVQLFFFVPTSAMFTLYFLGGMSVIRSLFWGGGTEGAFAAFAAIGVGYLLGASTPSPMRKWYLRQKLRRIEKGEQEREKKSSKGAAQKAPHLRLIKGDRRDSDPPNPDKRWLNLGSACE